MWQGCWYIPDRSWDAQSSGVEGAQQIRELIKDITHFEKIPTEWEESMISSLYKGKGVALERGNYRGLKLLDNVMNVLKRVDENFLRQQMRIDDMQFGFMPRRSTTDAIFIVHQLQRKFHAVSKTRYMAFVDLKKTLHRVPGRVIWWTPPKLGVAERLVRLIQSRYEIARGRVRVGCNLNEESSV